MCGIVSLAYGADVRGLGKTAESLLLRLEYRGYDSTGAAFIDARGKVLLKKAVGAPSKVCPALDIAKASGQRCIGQVRWATRGSVSEASSQPHHVHCLRELIGAHNGYIDNLEPIRTWLGFRGHALVSDNDGEVLVHLVEEHYAANQSLRSADLSALRQAYAASGLRIGVPDAVLRMIDALRKAQVLAQGAYAAIFADPGLPGIFAVNAGSSLYAGIGRDEEGGFVMASSDLTSVLSKTRSLIPIPEGEGLWFSDSGLVGFSLSGKLRFFKPLPRRSKVSIKETELDPKYRHFMLQEIMAGPGMIDQLLKYYFVPIQERPLSGVFDGIEDRCRESADAFLSAIEEPALSDIIGRTDTLFSSDSWRLLRSAIDSSGFDSMPQSDFQSDEAELMAELSENNAKTLSDFKILDSILLWSKRKEISGYVDQFRTTLLGTKASGGRIYLAASGSSYHAALTAAYFFNVLARIPVYACNPGIFRSMYLASLRDDDVLIGISQSGETKDLVDVFAEVKDKFPAVRRASLVNNESSRLARELSDFYLPMLCGPEIAVVATKSFISQLALLYVIAASLALPEEEIAATLAAARDMMAESLALSAKDVEDAAQRLYARPSIHVLGTNLLGLAKEGALKIREVTLNHTEGGEAAEFKHGPNTILGRNSILSLADLESFLDSYRALAAKHPPEERAAAREILKANPSLIEELPSGYPLIFLCAPDERDARITISQIHTHKIRGADILLFAERRQDLALAVAGKPAGNKDYWSRYIEIPMSGKPCLFVFGASILLQYLAYRMSVLKMEWLDEIGIQGHGVHPDVPKNVSKSITIE
ncbi:MAG: SIS domain-containing protein [Spirochaetia bacterium]|nr:SIS domain-containing protein [Spirochaetia bacterium]